MGLMIKIIEKNLKKSNEFLYRIINDIHEYGNIKPTTYIDLKNYLNKMEKND